MDIVSNMSETPRTDKEVWKTATHEEVVWASFARQLERELTDSQQREAKWLPIDSAPRVLGKRFLITKDCGEGTGKSVSIAYRLDKDEWYYSDGSSSRSLQEYGYRVTHWKPMLKLPTETG